jgi:hypothetical protein
MWGRGLEKKQSLPRYGLRESEVAALTDGTLTVVAQAAAEVAARNCRRENLIMEISSLNTDGSCGPGARAFWCPDDALHAGSL